MLSHYGLVQVLRLKAYVQGTSRLTWIGEGGYPLSRLRGRCYYLHADHIIEGALYLFLVLNRYLPLSMLDRVTGRVSPDGVGSRHVPYSVKGVWKGLHQGNYVLDHSSGGRGSHLSQLHLEGRFRCGSRGAVNGCFCGWKGLYHIGLGLFVPSTIYSRIDWTAEGYLEGSSLPQATLGRYDAVWLVQVDEVIMEILAFSSLPQATWGRGGGDIEGVYMGVCH